MTRRVFISIVVCLLALCAKADLSEIAKSCQITFSYNGEAFDPAKWSPAEQSLDGGLTRVVYTSPDGRLRLTVDYREYADFPVTEIRPVLECVGNAETGIVDNFKSLRLTHACKSQSVKIRRMTGSRSTYTDFCHHDVQLQRRHECDWLHMTSEEGRSAAWLPYFGVDYDSMNGIEVAIGWTGTWRADMQYKHDWEYWMEIGLLDSTHFKMLPGERFMMPYTVIYNRCNKSVQNGLVEFHRFIIEHKSPRDSKGKLFKPLLPVSASGGNKTDENMLKILNFTKRFDVPFDVYWIDANWYGTPRMVNQDTNCGSDWFDFVGDWRVNTVTHPKGNLKKISDAAHKAGMRFLVWFESERATPKAPILKKHPEYFHLDPSDPDSCDHLLDLGNPEARQWIVEEVSRNIRESGIDIYRQDFNMDPLPAWRANDAPDRKCVTEIKHINGLYAFWDELHRRFPDMMFENCASGGTRTDIEMMSRAHSYCRDDAQMWPNCDELTQNITINSTPYVPFTGGETFSVELYDNYAFLSRLGAGTVFTPSDFGGMILKREPSEKEIKWF
ncbi:MAG: alpha-galactosidase, partial [Bacteroidales bacterium]|nr:alpha-galactosidase [Candidatus Sodaliphilus aphodohippi]